MLLQSSQFDKLNNIIKNIRSISVFIFKTEILIENGEYESAENILGYYTYCIYYFFIFLFYFSFLNLFL